MPLVVVVGAGIGGLAAALALNGIADVIVLERRGAQAANAGAGIQISPNAFKALRAIGAADRVAATACAPDALVVRSGGRVVVRVAYRPAMEQRYGAPYLTASRAALHAALGDEAAALRIEVRYDVATDEIEFVPGGCHVPGIADRADLVVAADGIASSLRAKIVGDAPRETGWTAWRGNGRVAEGNETDLVLGSGHHLVRYPLSDENENCVLVARDARGPQIVARTATGAMMADVETWMAWPMRVRLPHVYHRGRVAFVGDGAHAMLPFLAQGGAMALEDAAVLGAMVRAHGLTDAALEAYGNARSSRVARVAAQAARQGSIYHMAAPLSLARDIALRRLGAQGVYKRMDWIYGWHPAG